ncbi:MAG: hypothetical protein ACR650_04110 [Methylocystis sp.]|jgi:uncharacterized protein (UPF0332 family)
MDMIQRHLEYADQWVRNGHGLTIKRRAVSTAYYAVFHALARLCADELLGSERETRNSKDYERIYRALEHKTLRSVFQNAPKDNRALRQIGDRVVLLQSKRHDADYLPARHVFSKAESLDLIASARSAVTLIGKLSAEERRALAVRLIIRDRNP